MTAAASLPLTVDPHHREIRGAPAKLWKGASGEIIISGPAGTGKTRQILEWIHARCRREKIRVLILRKTAESAKTSVMVTYVEQVLHEFDGKRSDAYGVEYFGGNRIRPAEFTYDLTGSKIILGGMNNASRVLSTEYDVIYVNECTELTIDEWEKLSGRVDRPALDQSRPPSLLIGDCNPDSPSHWIMQRANEGRVRLWHARHEDNPAMYQNGTWTPAGTRYLARLDKQTGVRYQRYRLGKWVAAEGQIYEEWNPAIHIIDRFDIPPTWPRIWVIDFGYVHPFVWLWIAIGPDGQMVVYRQIYMTRRLVADHAQQGMVLSDGEPMPSAILTDHDAEDRATFESITGLGTTPAVKNVSAGIQAVQKRLRPVVDGAKPRLLFMRDSLVEVDVDLKEAGKPTCTEDEFGSYVWNLAANRRRGEEPVKENDHGMDALRYAVADVDGIGSGLAMTGLDDDLMDSILDEYSGYLQ